MEEDNVAQQPLESSATSNSAVIERRLGTDFRPIVRASPYTQTSSSLTFPHAFTSFLTLIMHSESQCYFHNDLNSLYFVKQS